MRKRRIQAGQRREWVHWPRVAMSLAVAMWLWAATWHADLGAVAGLFQSPPTQTPETPGPTVTAALPSPTNTEAVEAPSATVEPATGEPETTTPSAGEGTPIPPASPTELPTPGATELLPTAGLPEPTRVQEPAVELPSETDSVTEPGRYADSDLGFDWGKLFDSLALLLSYVWLVCGVLLFVALPALFLALWARGRRQRDELTEGEPDVWTDE